MNGTSEYHGYTIGVRVSPASKFSILSVTECPVMQGQVQSTCPSHDRAPLP